MSLFNLSEERIDFEKALLYALGEFQMRGFQLEGRKIALDRLLGAFFRAFERFRIADMADIDIARALEKLGVTVEEVPEYVAKHPFRITVDSSVAKQSKELYKAELAASVGKSE